jgi:4-diphosphocytidyl-2C-methyl-D-erythritol kinase
VNLPEPVVSLSFILVNPGVPSGTAQAYQMLDSVRSTQSAPHPLPLTPAQYIESFSDSPKNWRFTNDFLPVFNTCGDTYTTYREIISCLYNLKADFAGLSGAGSTCFGVFSARSDAESAQKFLSQQYPFVIETFPLASRSIQYYND